MSWQGYLQFVYKQKEVVQKKIERSLFWEARDILERVLLGLLRTKDLAQQQGMNGEWAALQNFFRDQLNEVDALEQDQSFFYQSALEQKDMKKNPPKSSKSNPSKQAGVKRDQDPLSLYQQGQKNYRIILNVLEQYKKENKVQEQIDFLLKALMEAELSIQEQAHLNFLLGENYQLLKKTVQARQAFWKVRRLKPDYPGLQQKRS